jgi:N-acetylglucosaminyldiphosphoundecaprenol N-acetyl-beta-D-mannosaminyltransferase
MPVEHTFIFDRRIAWVPPGDLAEVVIRLNAARPATALFCNVHMLMLSLEDRELATAMAGASYVFADGVPVAWLQCRMNSGKNRVVRGYELMLELCKDAERAGKAVGLYGSSSMVISSLREKLHARYPNLEMTYCESPPFVSGVPELSVSEIERINAANLGCLFVSLGCPKQEKWATRYGPLLNCHVLAVGAAFDWLAGTILMPPKWMERFGLWWLFRLLQNPRKLWYRYLKYNSKFIYKTAKLLILRESAQPRAEVPEE